ncbi:hypothetical protein A5875_000483, partial [Enterococcus sp. 3H8_DIV0648]
IKVLMNNYFFQIQQKCSLI